MVAYSTPGVYREDVFPPPAPTFLTGVPCFLGYSTAGQPNTPQRLTLWPQFQQLFGGQPDGGYLADAVRGFFENDGLVCYVVRLDDAPLADALRHGLDALDMLSALNDGDDVDLICAPDIMRLGSGVTEPNPDAVKALQLMLLDYCQLRGDRFAILDGLPTADTTKVLAQAQLRSNFGALYYPWLYLGLDSDTQAPRYAPPCGHIAGSYSRSDGNVGVHKAPANDEFKKKWAAYAKKMKLPGADKPLTNDPMEATYIGIYMWKQAVEKAKSFDTDKVIAAMAGQTFKAPSGITSKMDEKNHHLHKAVFIGEVKADGQFNVVWKTKGPVKAQPWSPFIPGNDKKKDEPDGKSAT